MGTTAIIEAAKAEGLAPGDGVRDLLDGPEQAPLFDEDAAAVDRQLLGRRRAASRGGRKPGSKNRATQDVIRFVRQAYTDPLMWMGSVASMDMAELMAAFGFKKKAEAAEFQRKVVKDLRDTLYPGQTMADALKAMLGPEGLAVVGFMALGKATRETVEGAAGPDIHGGLSPDQARRRVPHNIEQDQEVSTDAGE